MQIDAAPDHVIRILRMHRNTVVVRHLAFIAKSAIPDIAPALALVFTPEHAEDTPGAVRCERVNHSWLRGRDGQAGPRELISRRQPVCQMFPTAVLVAPDTALRSTSVNGCEDFPIRVKHNRMAIIVVVPRYESADITLYSAGLSVEQIHA